jgi:hypothetical protein
LVGGATAVGQAFRFSLLPAAGLLQDIWLLSGLQLQQLPLLAAMVPLVSCW